MRKFNGPWCDFCISPECVFPLSFVLFGVTKVFSHWKTGIVSTSNEVNKKNITAGVIGQNNWIDAKLTLICCRVSWNLNLILARGTRFQFVSSARITIVDFGCLYSADNQITNCRWRSVFELIMLTKVKSLIKIYGLWLTHLAKDSCNLFSPSIHFGCFYGNDL